MAKKQSTNTIAEDLEVHRYEDDGGAHPDVKPPIGLPVRSEMVVIQDLIRSCHECNNGEVSLERGCVTCSLQPQREDCSVHVIAGQIHEANKLPDKAQRQQALKDVLTRATREFIRAGIPPKPKVEAAV